MPKFIDLSGKKFKRLTILKRMDNDKRRNHRWLCGCDCGIQKIVYGGNLKRGHTKSCGCLSREGNNTKHGQSKTKTYQSWIDIIQRCTNRNTIRYKNYGGRGITVCKRWLKFPNFLEDMGEIPEGYQIDRIDNNKGYKKSNCQWVTSKTNNRNRRDNLYFTYKNKTQLLIEWAEEYNINYGTLYARIFTYGWSIEKALTTPARKYKKRSKK